MQVYLTRVGQRELRRLVRKAKKVVAGTLAISFIVASFLLCAYIEHNYRIEAKITALDGYTYTAVDKVGYEWQFTNESLFPVGTKVTLKMYDNCTTSRVDDEIRGVVPVR